MSRQTIILAALFLAAAALALPAPPAEAIGGAGAIGPHVGWLKASDAEDGNFFVGGHLQLNLLPILAVQGAVDYRLANTYDLGVVGVPDDKLKVRSVPVTVTGRLYLPVSPTFQPFAAAGAGWYYLIYDYSDQLEHLGYDDHHTSDFGWHLGAGAEFALAPRMNLYLEGRWIWLTADQDLDRALRDRIEDFNNDAFYAAAGLDFVF